MCKSFQMGNIHNTHTNAKGAIKILYLHYNYYYYCYYIFFLEQMLSFIEIQISESNKEKIQKSTRKKHSSCSGQHRTAELTYPCSAKNEMVLS